MHTYFQFNIISNTWIDILKALVFVSFQGVFVVVCVVYKKQDTTTIRIFTVKHSLSFEKEEKSGKNKRKLNYV